MFFPAFFRLCLPRRPVTSCISCTVAVTLPPTFTQKSTWSPALMPSDSLRTASPLSSVRGWYSCTRPSISPRLLGRLSLIMLRPCFFSRYAVVKSLLKICARALLSSSGTAKSPDRKLSTARR